MSISPVPGIESASGAQFPGSSPQSAHEAAPARKESTQPDSGTTPKQDLAILQGASQSSELPQDEVEVQRDSGTNGEIVVRYVDQSGDVILQIPSSQMLDLTRAIVQDLQQEAKVRATAAGAQTDSEGGKNHGH